ncbi:MAG: hypothetical protein R3279_03065 [Putridiphycobacter sp.]|nr:hypothetical protein [Putridiphycobacter sp.]
MAIKHVLKNPAVQQYALELLFPIIGYLFFGWSFLVIVLFYLVDQLGNQINFFARLKFVQKLFLPRKNWLFPVMIVNFVILFCIELLWLNYLFKEELYNCQAYFYRSELVDFFYNEFWLFLPLLVLANYFKDKMTFYKTDLPYQISPHNMSIFNVISIIGTFALIAFVYAVWINLKPSVLFIIIVVAILKLGFEVMILPALKNRIFRKI